MAKKNVFTCAACKRSKPISAFRPNFRLRRGHDATCMDCQNARARARDAARRKRPCTVRGCNRPFVAHGYCSMHYARWRKTGEPGPAEPKLYVNPAEKPKCIEPGCNEPRFWLRRCEKHARKFAHKMRGTCKVEGCSGTAITKKHGLCRMHDARRRRWGDPLATAPRKVGPGVYCKVHGCKDVVIAKGYCAMHYSRWKVYGDPLREPEVIPEGTTRADRGGYVLVKASGHSESNRAGGNWAPQHRVVMANHLGRPLRENENVHHINGDRTDNRLENLELWVRSQPSGQRAKDLLTWAEEIVRLYGPERSKL